jgi:hypothetical protein
LFRVEPEIKMQEDDLQALRTAVAALEHPGLAALVISAGAQRNYLFELPNLGQVGAYLRAAHDASERTDLRYSPIACPRS